MTHMFDNIPTIIFPPYEGREWGIRICLICGDTHREHCYRMNFWKKDRWKYIWDKEAELKLIEKAIQNTENPISDIGLLRTWSSLSLDDFISLSKKDKKQEKKEQKKL